MLLLTSHSKFHHTMVKYFFFPFQNCQHKVEQVVLSMPRESEQELTICTYDYNVRNKQTNKIVAKFAKTSVLDG